VELADNCNVESQNKALDFRNPENFYHDVNSVTGLLKQFFRDLPDPLLTAEHHDSLVAAASTYNSWSVLELAANRSRRARRRYSPSRLAPCHYQQPSGSQLRDFAGPFAAPLSCHGQCPCQPHELPQPFSHSRSHLDGHSLKRHRRRRLADQGHRYHPAEHIPDFRRGLVARRLMTMEEGGQDPRRRILPFASENTTRGSNLHLFWATCTTLLLSPAGAVVSIYQEGKSLSRHSFGVIDFPRLAISLVFIQLFWPVVQVCAARYRRHEVESFAPSVRCLPHSYPVP
jgi:hypothetical protein